MNLSPPLHPCHTLPSRAKPLLLAVYPARLVLAISPPRSPWPAVDRSQILPSPVYTSVTGIPRPIRPFWRHGASIRHRPGCSGPCSPSGASPLGHPSVLVPLDYHPPVAWFCSLSLAPCALSLVTRAPSDRSPAPAPCCFHLHVTCLGSFSLGTLVPFPPAVPSFGSRARPGAAAFSPASDLVGCDSPWAPASCRLRTSLSPLRSRPLPLVCGPRAPCLVPVLSSYSPCSASAVGDPPRGMTEALPFVLFGHLAIDTCRLSAAGPSGPCPCVPGPPVPLVPWLLGSLPGLVRPRSSFPCSLPSLAFVPPPLSSPSRWACWSLAVSSQAP